MALDITLLRESFTMVSTRSPHVLRRFYETLFERHPALWALFTHGAAGQARQEKMLQDALTAVLEHIEDGEWLQRTLFGLGARHVRYGVKDEMYPWVGDSLLAALAEAAGPDWTSHLEAQWAEAYGVISAIMLAGAASVRALHSPSGGPPAAMV